MCWKISSKAEVDKLTILKLRLLLLLCRHTDPDCACNKNFSRLRLMRTIFNCNTCYYILKWLYCSSARRHEVNPFMPLISFNAPWKHQKTRGFMFSGGIKRHQWHSHKVYFFFEWFHRYVDLLRKKSNVYALGNKLAKQTFLVFL